MDKNFEIQEVKPRQVIDCRGDPTVEVEIHTYGGFSGMADVPVGRSTGDYEAAILIDQDQAKYQGRGVLKAIEMIRSEIAPAIVGKDVRRQREIDLGLIELDGTPNKSRLGANSIVGTSLSVAKTAASALGLPLYRYIGGTDAHILPVPILDFIEGGKIASTDLDFQEHQMVPVGAKTFSEAIRMSSEVYHVLGTMLSKKWGKSALNVGVEGGYSPVGMNDPRQAFDAELQAASELGYSGKFVLSLDVAASHLYDYKTRKYQFMGKNLDRGDLIEFYKELVSTYPLKSIEDPLEQNDFEGFAEVTRLLGIQIIGDDLFVTNPRRIKEGIEKKAANALLLKVNQIGTLTEALDAAELAFKNGYHVQVSERSGQTEDTWLADISVAINAGQIKTGCPARGERTAQYNRLLRIEEELGKAAEYPGEKIFQRS